MSNEINPLDIQIGGSHYKQFEIEPMVYCQVNKLPFWESNIIKYVSRHSFKNGLQDLRKAQHYLDLLIMEYTNIESSDEEVSKECEDTYIRNSGSGGIGRVLPTNSDTLLPSHGCPPTGFFCGDSTRV